MPAEPLEPGATGNSASFTDWIRDIGWSDGIPREVYRTTSGISNGATGATGGSGGTAPVSTFTQSGLAESLIENGHASATGGAGGNATTGAYGGGNGGTGSNGLLYTGAPPSVAGAGGGGGGGYAGGQGGHSFRMYVARKDADNGGDGSDGHRENAAVADGAPGGAGSSYRAAAGGVTPVPTSEGCPCKV